MMEPMRDAAAARGLPITVCGIDMVFGGRGTPVQALAGVSLEIAAGSFCSILGPSGCGKSTLMMLVAGLYRPTEGDIAIGGKRLDGCYTDAGIVFQTDVLLPWLSVLDNVLMPARVKRLDMAWARSRARDLLGQVGLSGFEARYPGELSGGMRQRVAICRALLSDPSILLMDEPFGALDALTREKMQIDLNRIWADDVKTVMLITHDIEEAVLLSDEVIVMSPRPGRILQRFPIALSQPRSPETRRNPAFHRIVDEIRDLFRATGVL
jgi:NitT/TauT family transport system ATP-binding protein